MKKKRGFTIVELLAVIAILGIIVTFAVSSVSRVLSKQDEKLRTEMEKNLKEAAIAYIQDKKIILKECSTDFSKENPNATENKCYREVKVQDIINQSLFEDNNEYCNKNATVLVYKENKGNYSELEAYVKEGTCR